jgi:acetyl esterase
MRGKRSWVVGLMLAGTLAPSPRAATAPRPIYWGVSYGPSPSETATVFAQSHPGAPVVVLVHGGGWRLQKLATEMGAQAKSLQLRGFVVVDVNYDQDSASEPAFPLETNDVIAATQWAIANAGGWDGDPANVVLLGGSAGGQLAAIAAERLDAAGPGTVRAVVSLSGPTNFTTLAPMAARGEIKDRSYVRSIGAALGCGASLAACSPSYEAEWSPALNLPLLGCPDWLLVTSAVDTVATLQAGEMVTSLQAAACSVQSVVVPTGHGFSYWPTVVEQIAAYIRAE